MFNAFALIGLPINQDESPTTPVGHPFARHPPLLHPLRALALRDRLHVRTRELHRVELHARHRASSALHAHLPNLSLTIPMSVSSALDLMTPL